MLHYVRYNETVGCFAGCLFRPAGAGLKVCQPGNSFPGDVKDDKILLVEFIQLDPQNEHRIFIPVILPRQIPKASRRRE
jgi:hypothetical protein